jgi:hypothetical protein
MKTEIPRSTGSFDKFTQIFSYDHAKTPDLRKVSKKSEKGITTHDLSWAGIAQERIRAYLVEPSEPGSVAGIIFVHPGPGDRAG